ncbi:hypothetical protein GCM10028807_60210 [Spirosoma daeguense]
MLGLKAEAQALINQLPSDHPSKAINLAFEYLVDSTDLASPQKIKSRQSGWQSVSDSTLMLGFTTHPIWCRFTVQKATGGLHSYALELTNFYVDSVTLYQPDPLIGWNIQYAGDFIPYTKRNPKTRYPTLYVTLSGKDPQTFYARVLATQHHGYQWKVWDKDMFVSDRLPDMDRYVVFTLVFMLTLFMLALLLFMYRVTVLRAYALWGLIVCMSTLFSSGYSSILFPTSPYWAHTSNYVAVGLLFPALAYYVVQACRLSQYLPRLVWLYTGFAIIGLLYVGLSFFVRHPTITWMMIAIQAIMYGFTVSLLVALYISGIRPVIWNVMSLLLLLPIYTYFYGRNAGFFTGSLGEESLKFLMVLSTIAEPFFFVMMLWQATRERIRTADSLSLEQTRRENIQALDKLKTDFFTNVSHELRTPVTLLLGPLQTLHERFPGNELYTLMHRNAERLQTLINQLLELAKLDAHQMRNLPTSGNLAQDMRVWVALFDSLAQSRSLTLTLDQNQDEWLALYDADKVEKILTNLLSNAIKHTQAGGSVNVKAIYNQTGILVEIRDTGEGITAEEIPHLFDRFYQGEGSSIRSEVGTGVGLALTYELVQLLNGSITVSSQPGIGTTFHLSIPIQEIEDLVLPTSKRQHITQSAMIEQSAGMVNVNELPFVTDNHNGENLADPSEKPLLLLVEDNSDLRTYIRMILKPYYTLIEAADGEEGLYMALDTLPELIITDLMMPRLDGLDMCRALRSDLRTDHIPLIILTAKSTVEERLIGYETGADDYLTKPFLPAELLLRLQTLRRRQATMQAYWQRTFTGSALFNETPQAPAPDTPPFLNQMYAVLEQHIDRTDFDVDQLADELALSSRTLTRKLKGLVDLTAREVIRNYRLQRGNEMLEQGLQPTQVAYAVGFGSVSSFGRAYKDYYGYPPSTRKG